MVEARSRFEKALTLDPDNQIAHSRIAYLVFRKGDFGRAASEAEIAVRLDPTDALSWVILGRSREAVKDTAKAELAYAAAIETLAQAKTGERLVSVALAHYLRAMLHILRGDPTGVEADLKETLRIYPKNAYAHYEYALQLLKAGRFAEAADAFKLASEALASFQPQETWVYPSRRYLFIEENLHYWRGVALREAGRVDEAIAEFEKVIPKAESLAGSTLTQQISTASTQLEGKVETSFYNVNYDAAVAYSAKGDKAKALSLIKTLLRVNMADADTLKRAKDLQKQLH
jgi:tetratricopeptide (TPR) repeat protein